MPGVRQLFAVVAMSFACVLHFIMSSCASNFAYVFVSCIRAFSPLSILHHAFISIFIALWAVITHYVTILMPILSYFTRFTSGGRMPAAGILGWKRSKYYKPILHNSKSSETPQKLFLEIIKNTKGRKYQRGPTPWP